MQQSISPITHIIFSGIDGYYSREFPLTPGESIRDAMRRTIPLAKKEFAGCMNAFAMYENGNHSGPLTQNYIG